MACRFTWSIFGPVFFFFFQTQLDIILWEDLSHTCIVFDILYSHPLSKLTEESSHLNFALSRSSAQMVNTTTQTAPWPTCPLTPMKQCKLIICEWWLCSDWWVLQSAYAIPTMAFSFLCHTAILPIYCELDRWALQPLSFTFTFTVWFNICCLPAM